MTDEELERIEEYYETRIGLDAQTVRLLVEEIRSLWQEREEASWSNG